MNNQKNRFFTFLLSLVPGCGEMYFGLYRQGISLLITFLLVLILPIFVRLATFSLLALVVWFYSFLHTHNLRSMPPEQFGEEEDGYIWENAGALLHTSKNVPLALAVVLIALGVYLVWDNTFGLLSWFSDSYIAYFMHRLPQAAVGVGIIWLGWKLICSKKQELEEAEPELPATAEEPAKSAPEKDAPEEEEKPTEGEKTEDDNA